MYDILHDMQAVAGSHVMWQWTDRGASIGHRRWAGHLPLQAAGRGPAGSGNRSRGLPLHARLQEANPHPAGRGRWCVCASVRLSLYWGALDKAGTKAALQARRAMAYCYMHKKLMPIPLARGAAASVCAFCAAVTTYDSCIA
jgi:hypothetical protein